MQQPTRGDRSPPEARYAHYFSIGHAACEIVLEFGQFYEADEEPRPHTRIITTPGGASKFLALLKDSMKQYETQYGRTPEDRNE
jgi:hypothetical protein